MSYILSEQDKSLLSAFYDGETTAAETAAVRSLLERSPEARAWLRDAGAVRAMSVEAASVSLAGVVLSGKLTGAAVAAAAAKQGALSGGGFFATARSPLGLTGAAAILLIGAIVAFQSFSADSPTSTPHEQLAVSTSQGIDGSLDAVNGVTTLSMDEASAVVPPITLHDLVSFAMEGSLPVNSERTQYVGMGDQGSREAESIRDIEARIATLDQPGIKALDSLAKLLRGSIVQVKENTCAVRSDLPELRMSVINKLERAQLTGKARTELVAARKEAEADRRQISTSLDDEIGKMKGQLLTAGREAYVLIETNKIDEKPTGDRNYVAVLNVVGPRNRIITVDPDQIRFSKPNPTIAVALASAETTGRSSLKKSDNGKAPSLNSSNGTESNEGARNESSAPADSYWMSITVNLFSGPGMRVIVSDDLDTTWESPSYILRSEPQIVEIYSQLNVMTDSLNMHLGRIITDKSKSPQIRAWRIISAQDAFGRRLQRMLDSLDKADADSTQTPSVQPPAGQPQDAKKNEDLLDKAADTSVPTDLESTCMPWEDCTGIG